MTEPYVLLVEDDNDLRAVMADLLRDDGIAVAEATNGVEALTWLHGHERPAVILLDLMMPKMNGVQFRSAQLAEPELAAVPVVLMTASTADAPLAGDNLEVLRKPLSADAFLSTVRRHV